MNTPFLLFSLAWFFGLIAVFFFLRSEKETKKFLDAEDKLQRNTAEEKSRLLSVIGSLGDGILVLDRTLSPWVINDAARQFLQITKQTPTLDDLLKPFPATTKTHEAVVNVLSTSQPTTLHDVRFHDKIFQVLISPVVERNGASHTVGVTILLQDITEEKSMEKMREDFSNMIVHELRSPIVAVKDSAKLMLKDESLNEEDQNNMLTLIYDQSNKLLGLVNSILDAARIEGGRLVLNKTIGDIGAITRNEVELFLSEAKKKHITLVAEIASSLPLISIDSVRITQVINNLLSNSLKYTNENGTIKISAGTDDAFEKNKDEGHIVLTISDNGIGIPKEKQASLFSKFGQIITSKTSGTAQKMSSGLGLYITKGIVEAHGGKISFVSEPGKGTTFTVSFPVSREMQHVVAPLEATPQHPVLTQTLPLNAPPASKMIN